MVLRGRYDRFSHYYYGELLPTHRFAEYSMLLLALLLLLLCCIALIHALDVARK